MNDSDYTTKKKTGCSCSLTSIFLLIAMTAATILLVNECKRSEIRLQRERQKAYKELQDKVSHQADTIKFSKQK